MRTASLHDLIYNVAYDFFTADTPDYFAPHTAEVMIWLGSHATIPVSNKAPDTGLPIYLAQGLKLPTVGNYSWTLYGGTRNNAPVLS